MSLFPKQKLAELDQLNCDIDDFLSLYEWIQEHCAESEAAHLYKKRYENLSALKTDLSAELNSHNHLPSASNHDKQDIQQLLLSAGQALTGQPPEQLADSIQSTLEKITKQLSLTLEFSYSDLLQSQLRETETVLQS